MKRSLIINLMEKHGYEYERDGKYSSVFGYFLIPETGVERLLFLFYEGPKKKELLDKITKALEGKGYTWTPSEETFLGIYEEYSRNPE